MDLWKHTLLFDSSLGREGAQLSKMHIFDFSRRKLWFQAYSCVYLLIFWWYKYIQDTWELINLKSGYAIHQQMGLQLNFTVEKNMVISQLSNHLRSKLLWVYTYPLFNDINIFFLKNLPLSKKLLNEKNSINFNRKIYEEIHPKTQIETNIIEQ